MDDPKSTDDQSKRTNEEKFYDFDDAEEGVAAVAAASANNLNGQKSNGKLVLMRDASSAAVATNSSLSSTRSRIGEDVRMKSLTSGGMSNLAAASSLTSGLAASSLTSLTDLINDWKSAKDERNEDDDDDDEDAHARVRRQALSGARDAGQIRETSDWS